VHGEGHVQTPGLLNRVLQTRPRNPFRGRSQRRPYRTAVENGETRGNTPKIDRVGRKLSTARLDGFCPVQGRRASEFQVFDDDLREISSTEVSHRTPSSDRTWSRRKRFVNNWSHSFVCQQRRKKISDYRDGIIFWISHIRVCIDQFVLNYITDTLF